MKAVIFILAALLSGCANRADYYNAVRAQNATIAQAQATRDLELARIASEAGRTGNTAGALAAGYMIGRGNTAQLQKIEPPESGVGYVRELRKMVLYGLGGYAVDRAADAIIESVRGAGGNTSYGGDYIGGDSNIIPAEVEEVEE